MEGVPKRIIGLPFSDLALNSDGIPIFVPLCCEYIKKRASTEGIFRRCGNKDVMNDLAIICSCRDIAFPIKCDIHDVASFFKEWLRGLPTPLITPSVVEKYLREDDRWSVVETLRHLDTSIRKTLVCIFTLIKEILDYSEQNKMTFGNMCICFLSSLTQQGKGVTRYPLKFFYESCIELIDLEESDFMLEGPFVHAFCEQDDTSSKSDSMSLRRDMTQLFSVPPLITDIAMNSTAPVCRARVGVSRGCRRNRFTQIIDKIEPLEFQ